MKSVMSHQFSQVPRAQIPRSSFDRSHGLKTTFDASFLIPFFCDEALPGDTFNLNMTAFARLATPIFPIMDNMFLETFFFAVPHRLIWDNWEKFCGAQDTPGASTDFTIPQVTLTPSVTGTAIGKIGSFLGLPLMGEPMTVSALPFRAMNLIYNEWFRDQNLQNSLTVATDDGPDNPGDYLLRRRAKRHDYFTSCLPWPQKGEAVDIPLGSSADIKTAAAETEIISVWSDAEAQYRNLAEISTVSTVGLSDQGPDRRLYADLTDATTVTINALRQAFQVQKLLERDARGGTRYTEVIRAHFGVTSPDARLQRPEFLGGGRSPINISPVPQTSSTDATTPQGNMAAFGTVSASGHGFTKSFTEHCVLIGFLNVRADLTYQQGIERMWSRKTRFDYYWPALAHIGEQAVLSKEIYYKNNEDDDDVFGYQERYAEYRYKPSRVANLFSSMAPGTLDAWHLAQVFTNRPVLGATFIEENVPTARVKAITDEPDFIFDSYINMRCARPMPLYGVPGFVDRF